MLCIEKELEDDDEIDSKYKHNVRPGAISNNQTPSGAIRSNLRRSIKEELEAADPIGSK